MTARTAGKLAGLSAVAALSLTLVGLVVGLVLGSLTRALDVGAIVGVTFTLGASSYAVMALLISRRHPANAIGWLFATIAVAFALSLLGAAYAEAPARLPAERWTFWLSTWSGAAVIPLVTLVLLLFPDGRLPSRRWRPALWVGIAALALLVVGTAFTPGRFPGSGGLTNPLGIGWFASSLLEEGGIGWAFTLLAVPLGGVSLVLRYRRATGVERQQLKFLALAAAVVVVGYVFQSITYGGSYEALGIAAIMFAVAAVPLATGAAILRYRLYDVDVVIRKTVVLGALGAFITAVYVVVVVGAGTLLGRAEPDLGLQVAATALVALAFQPVRERARRLANRLVYGERAEPYEVLARFASRAAGTYATEDVLPRTARVIGEGTGAARAEVWLRVGDELRLGAAWPEDGGRPGGLPMPAGRLPEVPGATEVVPVEHRGEFLGAVAVAKPPGEPLTPSEASLLDDLAKQAGLVLRNVRLTEELRARLEQIATRARQLRASRQRIVAAHDAERRRLERNIHDGAQQHLVALAVKLRLVRGLLARDPARAAALLGELRGEIELALGTLRDLAGGIYPSVLEERGIAAALEVQARLGGVPVRIEADGVARQPIETEAAVYFACLEAIQNAAKHAGATEVGIQLAAAAGRLFFSVRDDGRGFDPGAVPGGGGLRSMADRVEALGGRLEVRSAPGLGTTVEGEVPIRVPGAAP